MVRIVKVSVPVCMRVLSVSLLAAGMCVTSAASGPQKAAPAAKSAPTAKAPATRSSASSSHSTATAGKSNTMTAGHSSGTAANKPAVTHDAKGNTTTRTASGKEVTKSANGRVASVKTANGHEAKFGPNGHVREVHANGMTVRRGPGGVRRTEVERADHSRLVAYGHGRGYIQRPYSYGGHSYYARAYYDHGRAYNRYYRGYYYHGEYLNAYRPAFFYPAAYYGWAYNPWPAPVAYGWGWGASPWYGYYGAYFAPYPVYPSAAFWLADYLVAASLANAYAAQAAANSAQLHMMNAPHLVFASYDPATDATSPTMTKEVKDQVSEEINRELAAQKAQPGDDSTASSLTLDDGQPHVFVVSAGLTVSAAGQDCGLTEGDVLKLATPPGKEATDASLSVLASKKTDCTKDSAVTVEVSDLQEMHNELLASIDKGMAEMKDHPGQGGLPAPPADATAGTKPAPYAAAAPAPDPNGGAELDQQAQQGAQVEQEVVAEASAPDGAEQTAQVATPMAAAPAAAPARAAGPITIALGQTPAQVVAGKGEPSNMVKFPNKTVYIYPDMKVVFVNGKVSDVQ